MRKILLALGVLALSGTAQAANPIIISQATAASGIANGDAPGMPVTITQPGAYEFGSNLSGVIIVGALNVNIDLAGYVLHGSIRGKDQQALYGTVRNGQIDQYDNIVDGNAIATAGGGWTVENIVATGNGLQPILLGNNATVNHVTVITRGPGDTAKDVVAITCGVQCRVENSLIQSPCGIKLKSGLVLSNIITAISTCYAIQGDANSITGYRDNAISTGTVTGAKQLDLNVCRPNCTN